MTEPVSTLYALMRSIAASNPGATAVVAPNRVALDFAGLVGQVDEVRAALALAGLDPADRVAVSLPQGPEMAVAVLAVASALPCVPLDPRSRAEELAPYLSEVGARAVIVPHEGPHPARAAAHAAGLRVLTVDVPVGAPAGRFLLAADASTVSRVTPAHNGGVPAPPAAPPADAVALVLPTSGTTSRPRRVQLSHANLCASARSIAATLGLRSSDRALIAMPLFHVHGLLMWLATLSSGGSTACPPAFDPARFAAWLEDLRPTWYSAVPTIHQAVVALAGLDRARAARIGLRFVRSSSAPLPLRLGAELEALFGAPVIEAYGMTEASHQVASNPLPPGERRPGSVGRPAGAEVTIVDETGRPLPPGAQGEVAIRGEGVTAGYEGIGPTRDAEGWLRTGDLGRVDADGYLHLDGRLKEQVNRGGEKIAPREVEEALGAHPAVAEAVVFPAPHPTLGEDVAAAVVIWPGAMVTAQDLRVHVRARLADYKVPGQVRFVEGIPVGPTGKIQRSRLAEHLGLAMAHPRGVAEPPETPTEAALAGIWSDVLGVEVGRNDDFFELGGDSLRAAMIAARAAAVLRVPVLAPALFEAPTVAALAARIDAAPLFAGAAEGPWARSAGGPAPLSLAQQRLWLFETVEPGTAVYNEPAAWRLRGPLDEASLQHGLDDVVVRHEALRTTFAAPDGVPVQEVRPPRRVALDRRDLSHLPERDRAASVRELLEATATRPFDLTNDLLLRALLVRLGPQEHALLLVFHHLATDGWSRRVFVRDFGACYAARRAAAAPTLPRLALQPVDLAIWEQAQLHGEAMSAARAYWRRQLAGAPHALELPADRPRPPRASHRGGIVVRSLEARLQDRLGSLARGERATLFMALLAGFAAMAHRYTGADDVVIGVPSAGRNRPEAEAMVGFFVNTLPLRIDLAGDPTVRGLIARVRRTLLEAQAHEQLPFEQILSELRIGRPTDRPPLVQIMFGYDSAGEPALDLAGLAVDSYPVHTGAAKFDLSVDAREAATGLELTAVYSTDLFDEDRIARLLEHLEVLLSGMVADPGCSLSSLPLMADWERRRVLVEENRSARPCVGPDTIQGLVEAQVARTPDAVAIVAGSETLTYREVNARANRLARHLRSVGVGPERVVGVCLYRSPRLVVALLAVLKAGGAYVPLDPSQPSERIRVQLADSGARVALTETSLAERLGPDPERIIRVDDEPAPWADLPDGDLAPTAGPDALAIILYTSGSTGRPKGVLCAQRELVNYLAFAVETFGYGPADIVVPRASIAFDASVRELFGTLAAGARMVLLDDRSVRDPAALLAGAQAAGATVLNVVPSLLRVMADVAELSRGPIMSLRLLHIGGEPLFGADVRRALAHVAPRAQLVNQYGPTECSINASYHLIRPGDETRAAVPIGVPVWNATLYVLDRHGTPVPLGIPGELWVGGVCVARGYHADPELTAARFVPDPFDPTPDARMYRTGDVVCRRGDGSLEVIGRTDFQVKLRGNRVEPEEIEAVIRRWPGVQDVAVTPWPAGTRDADLAAYIVPTAGQRVEAAAVRGHVRAILPVYMVPRYIDVLSALPLTTAGKVDRRALPPPGRAVTAGEAYVEPGSLLEWQIAAIWEDLLDTRPIGATDDFFELGGHSLLAVRMMHAVEQAYGRRLPLPLLFEAPTVRHLANALLDGGSITLRSLITPVRREGTRPPFFFLHGDAEGGGLHCRKLADALGREQPFYAVHPPSLVERELPTSVEAMAADYVREIRAIQPQGPFRVGGFCNGGVVAFEIARQLASAGETVEALILLDASGRNVRLRPLRVIVRFAALVGRLDAAAEAKVFGWLGTRLLDLPGTAREIKWAIARFIERRRGITDPPVADSARRAAQPPEVEAYRSIVRAYVPGRYHGRVTVLVPERRRRERPDLWWSAIARDVDVRIVPGDHLTALTVHVAALAARIGASFMRRDDRTPPTLQS